MAFTIKSLLIFYLSLEIIPLDSSFVTKESLEIIKSQTEEIIEKSVQHTQCGHDLKALITDLYRNEMWAYHMVDASIKVNPGLLTGNIIQFGNFDQCLAIHENRTGDIIKGQYCSVVIESTKNNTEISKFLDINYMINKHIGVNPNMRLLPMILEYARPIFGVCIPASCSVQHLQTIWDHIENDLNFPLHADFLEIFCASKDKPTQVYAMDYYVYILFAVTLFIVISSTIYDYFCQRIASIKGNEVIVAFSLYTNTMKLFSSQCKNHNLRCMDGIKVLCMIWVVVGHRIVANSVIANVNAIDLAELRSHPLSGLVLAAPYAVDTFLTISGILIAYIRLDLGQKYDITLWSFYSLRIIRLGPALLATILFNISIIKYLGNGPFWEILMVKISGSCFRTGWLNLLFLNNFVEFQNQCMEQGWSLAIDSQLYAIAPLILHNFIKRPKGTLIAMLLMVVISMLYTIITTVEYDLGVLLAEVNMDFYHRIYFSTLSRVPPWLIGIFFGVLIYHSRNYSLKINRTINILLWAISLGAMLFLIFSHSSLFMKSYNMGTAIFYNAFSRSIWALAIGFVIFACSTGNGGFINDFLSSRFFIVTGKLTYSIYLIHIAVQVVLVGSQKQAKYFSNTGNVHDALGDLVLVFFCGTLVSLLFESPVNALLKMKQKNSIQIAQVEKQTDPKIEETNIWSAFSRVLAGKVSEKIE